MQVKRTGIQPGNLKKAIAGLGKQTLKVGWFPSAVYPNGTPVAGVMAVHEFGSVKMNVPARAPMRITQLKNKQLWDEALSKLSPRILAGKMSPRQAAELLGMMVVGDVQKTISAGLTPALSDRTIYARRHRVQSNKSTQPLVDTRIAFNTLTSAVEEA